MSNTRILFGQVEPLIGTFLSPGYFTFDEIPTSTQINKATYRFKLEQFGRANLAAEDLPSEPDALSNDMLPAYFGDNLYLFCNLYKGAIDNPVFIGYFGKDDQDYINTKLYSRGTHIYANYDTTAINELTTTTSNDYYSATGLYQNMSNQAGIEFLFVYDKQTQKVLILLYWYGAYVQAYDKQSNSTWCFCIKENYYAENMILYLTSNSRELRVDSYYIDVTPYVTVKDAPEYPGGGDPDDGDGNNPGQTQNDNNVGGEGTYDNSSDSHNSSDYYDDDNDSPFEPQAHDPNWNSGTPLYTLFKMSFSQVGNLITYLCSNTWQSTVTNLGLGNIFGAIHKCLTVPFDVSSSFSGYSMHILGTNTNVATSGVVSHLQTVDCGTITIDRYFGDFKDYAPYTKCYIYLPYIGVNEISLNQVQGKALSLVYGVDLLDGSCVARLSADDKQLYSFSGNCATEYPIVGKTPSSPLAAATNLLGNISGSDTLAATAGLLGSILTSQNSSSTFQSVGGVAGNWGNVGVLTPFVYLERPVQSRPNAYESQYGYTCNKYLQLSTLSGYTEVDDSIHLAIAATEEEKERILEYLTSGFYINSPEP